MRKRFDLGRVTAATFLVASTGLAVVVGPHLGLRGWAWFGTAWAIGVVGAVVELWRKRER